MRSHQPLPFTGQAYELELSCLLEDCQFQLSASFSKAVKCLALTTVLLSHPISTGLIQLCILSLLLQAEGKCSLLYLATSFVQGVCNQSPSCARICSSLQHR
jgi:hypothetical protein